MSATNLATVFLQAVQSAFGLSTPPDSKFYTAAQVLQPSGAITMFGGSSAPSGWLICDGSAVSRTTYASLFTAISTTYGSGDGSTTFNLPDLRGIFPRGAGSNGKISQANTSAFSATLGSYTNDQVQGHGHDVYDANSNRAGRNGGSTSTGITVTNTGGSATSPFEAINMVQDYLNTGNGAPRSGGETRPANLGVNFIIAT